MDDSPVSVSLISFQKNALEKQRQRRVPAVGDAGSEQAGLGRGRGERGRGRGVPARLGRCRGRHWKSFFFEEIF